MEKVATDIYSFARMREEGFTYVDKTEELYAMASGDAGAQFFMARPRRFGKSLAVSTLKCLFEGRRELQNIDEIQFKTFKLKIYISKKSTQRACENAYFIIFTHVNIFKF